MEETLSTLDYALRAKSIRNKPEVNQRMTRNALLKEYVAEIERLKADVLAAREKNGIFFSEERWKEMEAEQELKSTEFQEAKKQVDIIESQLRNVREEFEQSMGLLMRRDGELKETREKLQKKETQLEATEGQLKVVKTALDEEVVVRKVYQENETALDNVASGLKGVAHQSVSDLGRLFGKLGSSGFLGFFYAFTDNPPERKTTVFTSNVQAVTTHTRKIGSESREFASKLDDFIQVSNQHISNVRAETEQYRTKELETLATITSRMNEQIEKVQETLKLIHAKEAASDEAVSAIRSTVEETHEGVQSALSSWTDTMRQHCEETCKQAEASATASCLNVCSFLSIMFSV